MFAVSLIIVYRRRPLKRLACFSISERDNTVFPGASASASQLTFVTKTLLRTKVPLVQPRPGEAQYGDDCWLADGEPSLFR